MKSHIEIQMYLQNSMKRYNGFTLIEVLIAVVLLAGGLIGLAGLQAKGLSDNQSAYNRSQATQLAYDIADKMRANSLMAANYLSATLDPTEATCSTSDDPCTACESTANMCSPAQLVVKDLYDWNKDLNASLPGGKGSITAVGTLYTITVNWDDDKDGDVDDDDPKFEMRFQL
jgi:type IV pilus assembly protein PilV